MSRLMTKPTKWHVRPAKTQISLGIGPVWSETLLSAWRKLGSLATRWAHSEDSDQTGQMPRLIPVFARRTVILLVLSWGGSYTFRETLLLRHPTYFWSCWILLHVQYCYMFNIVRHKIMFNWSRENTKFCRWKLNTNYLKEKHTNHSSL